MAAEQYKLGTWSAEKKQIVEHDLQRRFEALQACEVITVDMTQETGQRRATTWDLTEEID